MSKYIIPTPANIDTPTFRGTSTFNSHIIVDGYTIDCSSNATSNQLLQYNGTKFLPATVTPNNPSSDFGQSLGSSSFAWGQLFDRHLVSGIGSAPTIAKGSGAGSTATVSVGFNPADMTGLVKIVNSGSGGSSSANLLTVTFNTAYNAAPKVLICPCNDANFRGIGSVKIYLDDSQTTTTTFTLKTNGALTTSGPPTLIWFYMVIE